jgi:CRISPR/Cas system-associated protein Cas5 (RAMP superfamily)
LQGIFLSIDENKEDIIGENKENKENKHDNDDMSTLTVESQDKMEESNSSQSEVKVKRKYTPRKKKNNT